MDKASSGLTGRPAVLFLAAVLGFFLADAAIVLLRAPSLLGPSNWSGLGVILGSGIVLYAGVALMFAAFYVLVWIAARLFRLRFSSAALGVITALGAPFVLIVQNELQRTMLGTFVTFRQPYFYAPTAITAGVFILIMALVYLIARGREAPNWARVVFSWRGLLVIGFCVFFLHGAFKITPVNVLGVFTEEEKRIPRGEHAPPALSAPLAEGPNFIVLKIEAFRTDEFTEENAPFLYKLAQDNIWFTRYYAVASSTRPSVTSFFTSLYPAQHGCYNLALGQGRAGEQPSATSRVAESIVTLPMLLQERGYRTLMTTSNLLTVDRMFGCEEVYVRFDAVEPYRFKPLALDVFVGYRHLYLWLGGWRVLKAIVTPPDHSRVYYEAPRVNAVIKQELAKRTSGDDKRPFFLYAHYMEPHSPYYFHPHRPVQINLYSEARLGSIKEAYRSEIGAIDRAIADLYSFLKTSGLLEDTYLFITADHGEEFLDHGDWGHGKSVYPEVMGVPAILVAPDSRGASRRADTLVENIDIMPTFAELAGVEAPEYWEGRSLAGYISSGAAEPDTAADGRGLAYGQFRDDGGRLWTTVITDQWQLIFREARRLRGAPEEERREKRKTMLFNLAEDPLAKHNLHGRGLQVESELVAALEDNVRHLELTAHLYQGEDEEIDSKALEQLKALGYIQ